MLISDVKLEHEVWALCDDAVLISILNKFNRRGDNQKVYFYLGTVATINEAITLDNGTTYQFNANDIFKKKRNHPIALTCPLFEEDIAYYKCKFVRHIIPGTKVSCPFSLEPFCKNEDPEFYTYIRNNVVDWCLNFSQKNTSRPTSAKKYPTVSPSAVSSSTTASCGKKIYPTEYEAELICSRLVVVNLSKNKSKDKTYTRYYFCNTCNGWHITSMKKSIFRASMFRGK